ncbi:MAG: pitrilysin family protein [Ginsengibacter sp.]
MKRIYFSLMLLVFAGSVLAQEVSFTEYNLPNGLHVVLHQDNKAPVVAVSVMYHVGSKDDSPGRTGFAHFFEHLLFEGTENIPRGEFFKMVSKNGGTNNANTTQDRTFYYEVFPSNQLKMGLWLESERMMHPIINTIGVKTQNEVVKEEKRLSFDNRPYGNFTTYIFKNLFTKHPYHNSLIGSMDDLDAATLNEFKAFNKKYYVPNNAVIVIAGDIQIADTKKWVEAYFGPIPKGAPVVHEKIVEAPITTQIIDTAYDANIRIPAIMTAYRVPGITSDDAVALQLVSAVLSQGASSRMYKKMVDEKKEALAVQTFNYALEDYGAYICLALPNGNVPLNDLLKDIDEEILKVQTDLISEDEFTKLRNQAENAFVTANDQMIGVAENLANGYTFYNNTNHINTELKKIKAVTREDIRNVAKKYLNPNQRLVLYYLPKK